jgi:hypothetical protein
MDSLREWCTGQIGQLTAQTQDLNQRLTDQAGVVEAHHNQQQTWNAVQGSKQDNIEGMLQRLTDGLLGGGAAAAGQQQQQQQQPQQQQQQQQQEQHPEG